MSNESTATADVLSQDEIDALLGGMSDGEVGTDAEELIDDSHFSTYDFSTQDRIVRGQLTALDAINQRFANEWSETFSNLLTQPVTISAQSLRLLKFADYRQQLASPCIVNVCRCSPLNGIALVAFESTLVFRLLISSLVASEEVLMKAAENVLGQA